MTGDELFDLFFEKLKNWKAEKGERVGGELIGSLLLWCGAHSAVGSPWDSLYGQIAFLAKRNECSEENVIADLFRAESPDQFMVMLQL